MRSCGPPITRPNCWHCRSPSPCPSMWPSSPARSSFPAFGTWSNTCSPFAILGFAAVGVYATRIFLDFFTRVLVHGDFDFTKNNSFGQMIPIFAFSMIGVGFTAPAAMSHNPVTAAIGIMLGLLFITGALMLGVMKIVLGFGRHAGTCGGTRNRADALDRPFRSPRSSASPCTASTWRSCTPSAPNGPTAASSGSWSSCSRSRSPSACLALAVMKRFDYFKHFVSGEGRSNGSLALDLPRRGDVRFRQFPLSTRAWCASA